MSGASSTSSPLKKRMKVQGSGEGHCLVRSNGMDISAHFSAASNYDRPVVLICESNETQEGAMTASLLKDGYNHIQVQTALINSMAYVVVVKFEDRAGVPLFKDSNPIVLCLNPRLPNETMLLANFDALVTQLEGTVPADDMDDDSRMENDAETRTVGEEMELIDEEPDTFTFLGNEIGFNDSDFDSFSYESKNLEYTDPSFQQSADNILKTLLFHGTGTKVKKDDILFRL